MNHRRPIRFSAGREFGESGYGRHQAVIAQSEFTSIRKQRWSNKAQDEAINNEQTVSHISYVLRDVLQRFRRILCVFFAYIMPFHHV